MSTGLNSLAGQPAPPFALPDDNNIPHTFPMLTGYKGLLLVFVRGTYCSVCIETLARLSRSHATFVERGLKVAVISYASPAITHSYKLSSSRPLDFPILADEDGAAHEAYGLGALRSGHVLIKPDGVVAEVLPSDTWPGLSSLLETIDTTLAA